MIIENDKINLIKEELASIAFIDSYYSLKPVLSERRDFAKTKTFQMLRKQELTEDELFFILINFTFQGHEIVNLLLQHIKNLTLEKFVKIGGVECVFEESQNRFSSQHELALSLLKKIKMDNPTVELKILLDYIYSKDELRQHSKITRTVLKLILNKVFIDDYEIIERKNLVEKLDKIEAIESNYGSIFDLMNNEGNYKCKNIKNVPVAAEVYYNNPFIDSINNSFIHLNNEKEYSYNTFSRIFQFLQQLDDMPFISFQFVNKTVLSGYFQDSTLDSIVLFYPLFTKKLKPNADVNKIMLYCENFAAKSEEDLYSIIKYVTDSRNSTLYTFAENIIELRGVTKARKNEIFNNYFREIEKISFIRRGPGILKLRMMIMLEIQDKKIANYLTGLNQSHCTFYEIIDEFICCPEKPHTYPGPLTMEVIAARELDIINDRYYEARGLKKYSNFTDELFFGRYRQSVSTPVLTWKMANNISFLKQVLPQIKHQSYKIRPLLDRINLKGIGFKKIITLLEDVTRKISEEDFVLTNNGYFYTGSSFNFFSPRIFEIATEEEIWMYKHRIPLTILLNSNKCSFKIMNYFLNLPARKRDDPLNFAIKNGIINNLKDNSSLTLEEKIVISDRVAKGQTIRSLMNLDIPNSDNSNLRIRINFTNSEKLTVADFNRVFDEQRRRKDEGVN